MASNGEASTAAGAAANGQSGLNSLPWQQIPRFVPGTTSVDEYCQRLRFLKELWPPEFLQYLAPRAALLVEGSAFQKVSRISPEKLKGEDGIKLLVESLGGAWGRTAVEEKYHYFEQAIFQVQQRGDESNDSYISRHDAFFEELLTRQITMEEVRAYVLLRHSKLSPEEKKKVVVEARGDLRYPETVKAVRLLGSKFFNDLHNRGATGGNKDTDRSKVYDINMAQEDDTAEEVHMAAEDEVNDEDLLIYFLEGNDEDAIYITEFEDGILEAIQESELANAFVSYQEARQRLRDKAKSRGYFPPSKGKGKGKGFMARKGKHGYGSWNQGRGRSLTDRIANSACRLCGQKGHWKRECPRRAENSTEVTNYTQGEETMADLPEILHEMPDAASFYMVDDQASDQAAKSAVSICFGESGIQGFLQTCFMVSPKVTPSVPFGAALAKRLLMLDRTPKKAMDIRQKSTSETGKESGGSARAILKGQGSREQPVIQGVFVVTTGAEGVLDTGASRTVVGECRIKELLSGLPAECRKQARKIQSGVTFRFGNSGTLTSKFALILPAPGSTWIRIEVIPGETPLLISNRLLRDLDAVIHVKRGLITLGNGSSIATRFDERGLSIVDMSSLLLAPAEPTFQTEHSALADLTSKHSLGKPPTLKSRFEAAPQPFTTRPLHSKTQGQPWPIRDTTQQLSLSQKCQHASRPSSHLASVPVPNALVHPADGDESAGTPLKSGHRRAALWPGGQPLGRGRTHTRAIPQGRVREAPRSREPEDVGRNDHSGRKAQGQESQRCVRQRHVVRGADGSKDVLVKSLGAELQELCHGPSKEGGPVHGAGQESTGKHQVDDEIRPNEKDEDVMGAQLGIGRGGRDPERVEDLLHREGNGTALEHRARDGESDRDTEETHQRPNAELPDARGSLQCRDHDAPSNSRTGVGATRGVGEGPEGVSDSEQFVPDPDREADHHRMIKTCERIDQRIHLIEEKFKEIRDGQSQWSDRYRLPSLDLIEITAGKHGEVSTAIQRGGGKAITVDHQSDLRGVRGPFDRLWQLIHMYEPRHLWLNVQHPWQAHRPKGRSKEGGSKELWPEELILELYRYQVERGAHIHIHCGHDFFEQSSEQLREVQHGTLCGIHCLSDITNISSGNNHLRQCRLVYTTSRQLQQTVDTRGKSKPTTKQQAMTDKPVPPPRLSSRPERFARLVAQVLRKGVGVPLPIEELLFGESKRESSDPDVVAAQQVLKRRRLHGKQTMTVGVPSSSENAYAWEDLFREINPSIPRVGRTFYKEGDVELQKIQGLVPQMIVKCAVVCRGTDRIQLPPVGTRAKDMPLRYTVVVRRDSGEVCPEAEVENWEGLPRYKQIRKGVSAKLSVTVYGHAPTNLRQFGDERPPTERPSSSEVIREANSGSDCVPMGESQSSESEGSAEVIVQDDEQLQGITGHPPRRIPRHGPGYLALGVDEKRELVRLHNNLGHPNVETFVKFLQERKAEPSLIQGARDFECSTCHETMSSTKASRPAAIHPDGDFGDVIGMDVAYWTNASGQRFLFTHIVDEATLFQQAVATGRTPEEQFEVLSDQWFQWAGPCKVLYVDPAGEYNSDFWRLQLQKAGIQTQVSAGEAHWQLGRTEAHGRILKSMLTRMDHAEAIGSEQDFRKALRAAVQAKNSLSRVKGFTPEQAVLGKMTRLPCSLVADEQSAGHALAISETPEGVQFRQDLQRREQARVAFIQADNDNAYRRALLRRSRPQMESFEAGDWVLYWRRQKNGGRGERGRWYGPGQVVCSDRKVIWISHCGQLIRAAPEQTRSASMREWKAAMQSPSLASENYARQTRQIIDLAEQGELPRRTDVEEHGPTPVDRLPVDVIVHGGSVGPDEVSPEATQNDQPEMEVSPAVSHAPDEEEFPELDPSQVPLPDDDDIPFGDEELFLAYPNEQQMWELQLHETEVKPEDLPTPSQALHYVLLATPERKKRVEVRLKDLGGEDQKKFELAKAKEIGAWLDHRTVRRVAAGTLSDHQLMRCRWVLTWKPPEKEGGAKRAKARLVVLGFEDPDLSDIPNDAPTLGKDARQLLLQKIASNRWKLVNFDVSTAFLQGQGDGRKIGILPPVELKRALKMQAGDQCLLEGGAYGRIDAPFLWFQTFKKTLEDLGFVQSPFDACMFSLVTQQVDGSPRVHGVLGIHVDDGIGGGDDYFSRVIKELRAIYSFGSYDENEFTFTGIHFRQWDDCSIELDQIKYIEGIHPIHVPKHRRQEPTSELEQSEVQELRRLNGSLQYAAVHTRPDLAAKIGYLQSRVNKGQVQHLLEANKVLYEAKSNALSLMIVPIRESAVTFCTFSDASFATSKDNNSYQGTLVVATDWRMLENQRAVITPMAWSSRKIARVVRSTLSAEVVSLCASIDRMSWLRLFWEWMKDPSVDIAHPEEVLQRAPKASLVTDCKSAYDISTKTAVPSCAELRTQLECLLLRERLQENCQMRWVHSRAMLADCLTKVMDSADLRRCLSDGTYALCDESRVLADRAGHRQSLKWMREQTAQSSHK